MEKKIDAPTVMQRINETLKVIEQYKAENPGVDIEAILSAENELRSILMRISSREVDKFVAYAKEQGTKMPFDSIETGILAAGRNDMKNGLAEILNSLKFEKPASSECDEIENRGRSKKKF